MVVCMRASVSTVGVAFAFVGLAACSTTTSSPPPPAWEAHALANVAQNVSDTSANILAGGGTLSAYNSNLSTAALILNEDNKPTQIKPISAPGVSIAANASGGHDVTIDGKTFTFTDQYYTSGQGLVQGWQHDAGGQGYFQILSTSAMLAQQGGGELASLLAGEIGPKYHQLWRFWWDDSTSLDYQGAYAGFAVMGAETHPDNLPQVATYTGSALFGVQALGEQVSSFGSGTVTIDADFASSNPTVSGIIPVNWGDELVVGTTLTLENGSVSGNGFTGTVTGDSDFAAAVGVAAGTYGGTLFGPAGEEIGGIVTMTGSDVVVSGAFTGAR